MEKVVEQPAEKGAGEFVEDIAGELAEMPAAKFEAQLADILPGEFSAWSEARSIDSEEVDVEPRVSIDDVIEILGLHGGLSSYIASLGTSPRLT